MLRKALLTTGIVGVAFAVSAIARRGEAAPDQLEDEDAGDQGPRRRAGTWRWQRKYTKHAVKVRAIFQGRLDDKCPGDGFGAYLE